MSKFFKAQMMMPRVTRESIRTVLRNPIIESTIDSIDIVDEKEGKGLSIKTDGGVEYRYTFDELSKKYNSLEELYASIKKLFDSGYKNKIWGFLRNNAIMYFKQNI